MPSDYLHNHPNFSDLIRIVARDQGIDPVLVEKDYWIMHCLFGLRRLGLTFELKGGTSLSKGFRIIDRFSEDIDIRIEPPAGQDVKTGRNHTKAAHIESRRAFYDWLATTIRINGIKEVKRDTDFDNATLMSAGIRLFHESRTNAIEGLKQGILLEVGFDNVAPNTAMDVSSWMYDYAASKIDIIDNRAKQIACYDPGFTLVEKLQTISTKFRQQQQAGNFPINFMRHYYDVYRLLQRPEVQAFIGTAAYNNHKARRFRAGDNQVIAQNEAFILSDTDTRKSYEEAYNKTSALYYAGKPSLDEIIQEIGKWKTRL
jgi:predicted nucleotidyltransferase component of viral defense system